MPDPASPKVSFQQFLELFPELELPTTVRDEMAREFSQQNDPIHPLMIDRYLLPFEQEDPDDLTEFVACFRIPDTGDFHALVYWRAALLSYEFVLATYTKDGKPIDSKVIAGVFSDGKTITRSVATLDEDWEINIMSGQTGASESDLYDATTSRSIQMELLPDGVIAESD